MTDKSSIDLSLTNVWRSWRAFRAGKKPSRAILFFESNLEQNLLRLCYDLNNKLYVHGGYDHKIVKEKKRRDIAVATVRDRVVHRMLYDFLVPIVDKKLDYDVWSCRRGKGLSGALTRCSQLLRAHYDGWVWRADIVKFFDNVQHDILRDCVMRQVTDKTALYLFDKVIASYKIQSQPASQPASQPEVYPLAI